MNNPRLQRERVSFDETTISAMWEMPHRTYCLSLSRGGYPQREPVAGDSYLVT